MDENTRSQIALGEKFPRDLLQKCIDQARSALQEGDTSAGVFNAIPTTGVTRKNVRCKKSVIFEVT
jgi:hypothetical protein